MIFDNLKLVDQRNINGGIYIEIYFNDLTIYFLIDRYVAMYALMIDYY